MSTTITRRRRRRTLKTTLLEAIGVLAVLVLFLQYLTLVVEAAHDLGRALGIL